MTADDPGLGHLDAAGRARMVDVSSKPDTDRTARAAAFVSMSEAAIQAIASGDLVKGDAVAAARIAGIMAAKKTPDLIPLCHQLPLTSAEVSIDAEAGGVRIEASASTTAKTGVEMEALVAACIAALTIYDMCKGIDRSIRIESVQLLHKSGGRTGTWNKDD